MGLWAQSPGGQTNVLRTGIEVRTGHRPWNSRARSRHTGIISGAGIPVIAGVIIVGKHTSLNRIAGIIRTCILIVAGHVRTRGTGPSTARVHISAGVSVVADAPLRNMKTAGQGITTIQGAHIVILTRQRRTTDAFSPEHALDRVQALPSSQGPEAKSLTQTPLLHESSVHRLSSLQFSSPEGVQTPSRQLSPVVQSSPSSQSPATARLKHPFKGSHPSTVQVFPSSQGRGYIGLTLTILSTSTGDRTGVPIVTEGARRSIFLATLPLLAGGQNTGVSVPLRTKGHDALTLALSTKAF